MRLSPPAIPRLALLLLFAVTLGACGGGADGDDAPAAADAGQATLSGTVAYRERMALPINATITVRLQDVSRADAPAVVLAEQSLSAQGQSVPIPFELSYDPVRIQERFSYAVRAEIRGADGALLWTTDTVHPVLTRGAPTDDVDIMLVRVAD